MYFFRPEDTRGLTLLELLIAISIMSIIGGVCARVLAVAIESWNYRRTKDEYIHEACWAMDHIINRAKASNRLLFPLSASLDPNQTVLSFSAMVDTDGDGLIDEDPDGDINNDQRPGIAGKDDNGDGIIDNGGETKKNDDDEDGSEDEDPIEYWLYYLDTDGCLKERYYTDSQTELLVKGVTRFEVLRTESDSHVPGVYLTLCVSPPHGEEICFNSMVYFKK